MLLLLHPLVSPRQVAAAEIAMGFDVKIPVIGQSGSVRMPVFLSLATADLRNATDCLKATGVDLHPAANAVLVH